jgi:A1 cistron-splicing factor AAR2
MHNTYTCIQTLLHPLCRILLGEFQLAFVTFLMLWSLSALENWKAIIALLCSSGDAMIGMPALFTNFITAFEVQVS